MRSLKSLAAMLLAVTVFLFASLPALAADIVDTAVAAGSFETLTAALEAAGLVDTLKGEGPFTVFAPTDEAFAEVPSETLENLLEPENQVQLTEILLYHVVAGEVFSSDLESGMVKTVNGEKVKVEVGDRGVRVDDATVVKADIEADNGVIHVIDRVLIP